MLGKSSEDAKTLTKNYPNIFHRKVKIAHEYLLMLDSLKAMDREFNHIGGKGKELSNTLLAFLNNKIQLQSAENMFLTLLDVIKFCKVCQTIDNDEINKYATNALNEAEDVAEHVSNILIQGFNYINVKALSELNLQLVNDLKNKENKAKDNKNSPGSGSN